METLSAHQKARHESVHGPADDTVYCNVADHHKQTLPSEALLSDHILTLTLAYMDLPGMAAVSRVCRQWQRCMASVAPTVYEWTAKQYYPRLEQLLPLLPTDQRNYKRIIQRKLASRWVPVGKNRQLQADLELVFKDQGIIAFSNCCPLCNSLTYACVDVQAFKNRPFQIRQGGLYQFSLSLNGPGHDTVIIEVTMHYRDYDYLMAHWEAECAIILRFCRVLGVKEYEIEQPRSERRVATVVFKVPYELEEDEFHDGIYRGCGRGCDSSELDSEEDTETEDESFWMLEDRSVDSGNVPDREQLDDDRTSNGGSANMDGPGYGAAQMYDDVLSSKETDDGSLGSECTDCLDSMEEEDWESEEDHDDDSMDFDGSDSQDSSKGPHYVEPDDDSVDSDVLDCCDYIDDPDDASIDLDSGNGSLDSNAHPDSDTDECETIAWKQCKNSSLRRFSSPSPIWFVVVIVCHCMTLATATGSSSSSSTRRWWGRRYEPNDDDWLSGDSSSSRRLRVISGREFDLFEVPATIAKQTKNDIVHESEQQIVRPVSSSRTPGASGYSFSSRSSSTATSSTGRKFSEYGRSAEAGSGFFLIPPPVAEWWTSNVAPSIKNWPKLQCRVEPTTTLKIRKTFRPLKTIVQLGADFNTQLGVWQFKSSWEDAIIGGKLTLAGRELQLTKSWQLSVGAVEDLVTRLRLRAAVDLQTLKASVRVGFRTERLAPINVMEGFTLMKQVPLDGNAGHIKLEVKANVALPEPEIEYSTETQRSLIGMGNIEVSIEELNLLLDY